MSSEERKVDEGRYTVCCSTCQRIGGRRVNTDASDLAWQHHQMHARDGLHVQAEVLVTETGERVYSVDRDGNEHSKF